MSKYRKRFCLLHAGRDTWVMSEYTGEIAKPYQIGKIFKMLIDMLTY